MLYCQKELFEFELLKKLNIGIKKYCMYLNCLQMKTLLHLRVINQSFLS